MRAVIRHVEAAVSHYERGVAKSQTDAFTDVIYRTNQAFEGSLKEAYRILAEKSPKNVKLDDIEKFIEGADVIRQRVLEQFRRYRQDYRNPSTHEYVLDFDADEALLAILSVCAFAKLLADQISEKIAYSNAREASTTPPDERQEIFQKAASGGVRELALNTVAFLQSGGRYAFSESEFEGALAGFLSTTGVNVELTPRSTTTRHEWDLAAVVEGDRQVLIEIKSFNRTSKNLVELSKILGNQAKGEGAHGLIIVAHTRPLPEGEGSPFVEYKRLSYKDTDNFEIVIVVPRNANLNFGTDLDD